MAPGPSSSPKFVLRSLLFAPGNRADVLIKMPRSAPSAAVIDLEDAVPPDQKSEARTVAHQVAPSLVEQVRLFVRVNAPDTEHFVADVRTGLPPGLTGIAVPKLESAEAVDAVIAALDAAGHTELAIAAGDAHHHGGVHVRVCWLCVLGY